MMILIRIFVLNVIIGLSPNALILIANIVLIDLKNLYFTNSVFERVLEVRVFSLKCKNNRHTIEWVLRMKKAISILLFLLCLFALFFLYKGSIEGFKEHLSEKSIEFNEVSINHKSIFDKRLLGKEPHHLEITSEDFLHIYKFPSKNLAKNARDTFRKKTESMDMVAHNLYVVEDMFIIYEYHSEVNDFNKNLSNIISEYKK